MTTRVTLAARAFFLRLALAAAIVCLCVMTSRAGGPKYVAGTTYFDSSTTGQPLTWPQGMITYYTDQGDLSPILPNASANSFVANAFSIWTAVPTAAISATTSPADITPSATSTPVGVVYDYDGAVPDGPQSVTIADPVSGASTTLIGALTYGAAATDNIVLLNGSNPSTPVGAQAQNPMSVRVLAADGVTAVAGATIGWSATNSVQISACGGSPSCSVTSDQNGDAFAWLTPTTAGVATITATLAPGIYNPSQSVLATLNATESSSQIGVSTPYLWVSQGASVTVPLSAIVLSNGTPQNNVSVNFTVLKGSATLSAASAPANSSGYATVNLTVSQLAALVQVSACVGQTNSPCGTFYVNPVPLAQQNLQQIAGAGQITTAGQAFQPVVIRVTDSSSPPNSVLGAPVNFLTTVLLPEGANSGPGIPVILQVSQMNATSDINGLASVTPSGGGFSPPIEVDVLATAGTNAVLNDPLLIFPVYSGQTSPDGTGTPPVRGAPIRLPTGTNSAR